MSPEVKAQRSLSHALCGFVIKMHWALKKTVNHGTAFPISCVSCRVGELRVIIAFVENLTDDSDGKFFLPEQCVTSSSFSELF